MSDSFLRRTWVEVDLDAIEFNFREVKKKVPHAKVMAVVKADAYGHGVEQVAQTLERAGADWFGVSNLEEALQLRALGHTLPILILGYTPPQEMELLCRHHITQAMFSPEYAAELSQEAVRSGLNLSVHLKLDVGMSRIGFSTEDDGLKQAVEACRLPGIQADGVFTHFQSADLGGDPDGSITHSQFEKFCSAVDRLETEGNYFSLRHCCNSAASVAFEGMQLDLVRAGISLYGLSPSSQCKGTVDVHPAMQCRTMITMVKEIAAGEAVGYGRTYIAPSPRRVATVCIGYADGYLRAFSNRAYMLVHGQRAPVIGNICMDQAVLDVTDIKGVQPGDTATVFGKDGQAFLPLDELADAAGTIHYELACLISRRVPRVYHRGDKVVHVTDYLGELCK